MRVSGREYTNDLNKIFMRECSPDSPCDQFQGVCYNDDGCVGNLICFQNDAFDTSYAPGCVGTDYCMPPEDSELAGFDKGMAIELSGTWIGEEKWVDVDGTVYDYCSRALFRASASSKNYLSWTSNYAGMANETCETLSINPKSASISDWYYESGAENLLLGDGYKACLTEADCSYDVTTSEGYEGFEVLGKSCGVLLLEDVLSESYDCEVYQVTRVEGMVNETMTTLDVVVMTYGPSYTGSFGNFSCPTKATFDAEDLAADPNGQGTTRFVLQSNATLDLADWECKV